MKVEIVPAGDFTVVGALWTSLELEAGPIPPFRSWTWVGCLAEERFDDPVLLRAEYDGRTVGLALFNRRRGRLHLGESGDARHDSPFVEHNGPLVAAGAGLEVSEALIRMAWTLPGVRRLVLSGVDDTLLAAGAAVRQQVRLAPFVDLTRVRAAGGDPLTHASANTRQQIRRSMRRLAERGGLQLDRAATEPEALAWFDALTILHQHDWQARGKPGAFADPYMVRFHRALIARAFPVGEAELLRLCAGDRVLGYLYSLRRDGHVCAYQSGFDRRATDPRHRPGLVAHALAIGRAASEGAAVYDFLAGEDRYKLSLATGCHPLVWAELVSERSVIRRGLGLLRWVRRMLHSS